MTITGSLIQAHITCHRQSWLMSRQLNGDQNNEFLSIGRLYSETTYQKEKKEISIENNKIDWIKNNNGELTIIETKKSSKLLNTAKMQLLHYLYEMTKKNIIAKGEIRVPKEKKIISIELDEQNKSELERIYHEIDDLIKGDKPPIAKWITPCKTCSYSEFCWA